MAWNGRLIDEATRLIAYYFGDGVAGAYAKFYGDKADAEILESCERMLVGIIGPEKTAKKMAPLYERYGTKPKVRK